MVKFLFCFRQSIDSKLDLVKNQILEKPIKQYNDADLGNIIKIQFNDLTQKISNQIEFEVIAINHHIDINQPNKPTLTLMAKHCLRYCVFDAKEDTNPDENRKNYGNNRWSVSNIRQWLNSNTENWYTPQHTYDAPPIRSNVLNYNPYDELCTYFNEPRIFMWV